MVDVAIENEITLEDAALKVRGATFKPPELNVAPRPSARHVQAQQNHRVGAAPLAVLRGGGVLSDGDGPRLDEFPSIQQSKA